MTKTTEIIIWITGVIIVIDLLLLGDKRPTISRTLLDLAYKLPIIPFAIGVLMGHLFWPN